MPEVATRVPIRDNGGTAHSLLAVGGLAAAIMWPLGLAGLLRGEWGAAIFVAIPAAIYFAGRWATKATGDEWALLTAGGIEFAGEADDRRNVAWSDIVKIRWPRNGGSEESIILLVRSDGENTSEQTRRLPYRSAPRDDRLTLIRTLRFAAPQAAQTHWPEFCQRIALPLAEAEACPKSDEEVLAETFPGRIPRWYVGPFLNQHPFAAGLLSPLAIPYLFARLVSRGVWWCTGLLIAVSAVVNIRLVWGFWAQPFTNISLGVAAVCFALGLFAGRPAARSETNDAGTAGPIAWLASSLIGMPLLANALVLGWIPPAIGKVVPYIFLAVLFGPLVFFAHRSQRRRTEIEAATREEALARWEELAIQ